MEGRNSKQWEAKGLTAMDHGNGAPKNGKPSKERKNKALEYSIGISVRRVQGLIQMGTLTSKSGGARW
jgi:hypothetical protein